jgi:pantoate--beta-alanine ligase
MRLIHSVAELRQALAGAERTAFVPTMGNLHAGHIDLVRQARLAGGPVVVSIFVNPLQFGQGEDFERYPRTLEADCAQLEPAGADIVFCPDVHEMYPEAQTFQVQPPLADELCGAFRPGHFQGVCTVVLKLFAMVRPKIAVFGKKDYQQLHLLKGMTRQFNLGIDIIEAETQRADDGLALSSRNGYLSPAERAEAPRLYRLLNECVADRRNSPRDFAVIEIHATRQLTENGWHVDYVSIRSQATLLAPSAGETRLVILAAARLGKTRLIDNLEFNLG